jgi:hypothetical protein
MLWTRLTDMGHHPLCLLNGLIGAAIEDVVFIIGFEDYDSWQQAQPLITDDGKETSTRQWIEHEQVRLMLPSSYRPTKPTRDEDRRPVYGMRRWWIYHKDWKEFTRLSYEGVWPALDHMGHYVLGQFRDAATTSPLEILNLAGYHDPSHWQATRNPEAYGVPKALLEKFQKLGCERRSLVQKSYVCLMRAHWRRL